MTPYKTTGSKNELNIVYTRK